MIHLQIQLSYHLCWKYLCSRSDKREDVFGGVENFFTVVSYPLKWQLLEMTKIARPILKLMSRKSGKEIFNDRVLGEKLKFLRNKTLVRKLSIKRMKMNVCNESSSSSSSEEESCNPTFLPNSSGELSTIEESNLEQDKGSNSDGSSSSKYMSSYLNESMSSISSLDSVRLTRKRHHKSQYSETSENDLSQLLPGTSDRNRDENSSTLHNDAVVRA